MKKTYVLLMFLCASAAASSQSATPSHVGGTGLPFTIEITANLDTNHPNEWDFANRAETTVKAGSMVVVAIRKTNISDHEIAKQSETGLRYDVRDGNGNLIENKKSDKADGMGQAILGGGEATLIGAKDTVLKPGESKVVAARMSDVYEEIVQPGTYTIQVSEHVSDDPASEVVRSNKITITVLPPDPPTDEPK